MALTSNMKNQPTQWILQLPDRLLLRAGLLLCLVLSFFSSQCLADEFHVRVSGRFSCLDNGTVRPLANARVEIMDSDNDVGTFGDDLIGVTQTNKDGYFSEDCVGGDGGNYSWSKPDVYARVILQDDFTVPVRVVDELNSSRSMATPQHDHDNIEGDVSIGSWFWGTPYSTDKNNASAPSVWLDAEAAVLQFANLMHIPPPSGQYNILYWSGVYPTGKITPYTTYDFTHWPRHYSTKYGVVTTHEFYHAVRHTYDGDENHFNWDCTRFIYGRSHSFCDDTQEGYAFNEGWAEFGGYTSTGAWPGCTLPSAAMTVEGNVALALADLENRVQSTFAKTGVSKSARVQMLEVLRDNPGKIHSYTEYCTALDKAVPGLCGSSSAPLTTRGRGDRQLHIADGLEPPSTMAATSQVEIVKKEIDAHSRAAITAQRKLRSALYVAAKTRLVCEKVHCEDVYRTLVRPVFLKREIGAHKLAQKRLQWELKLKPDLPKLLAEGTFQRAYVKATESYFGQLRQINEEALNQALRAATRLAKRSPDALLFVERLKRKKEQGRNKPIPISDQIPLLAHGEVFEYR
jgi:hypothetical protein